jgi:hypothetical protein
VVLIHPGLVKTDMNPYGDIEIIESARGMLVSSYQPSMLEDIMLNVK